MSECVVLCCVVLLIEQSSRVRGGSLAAVGTLEQIFFGATGYL